MSKHQIYTTSSVTLHVSVWVEISIALFIYFSNMSRSTWACELKYYIRQSIVGSLSHAPRERVSWNCNEINKKEGEGCHAPRERVSWNYFLTRINKIWILSRSTWACELKCTYWTRFAFNQRHAPRERVSWNKEVKSKMFPPVVTLHVSVWVEINLFFIGITRSWSRSTWACELKSTIIGIHPSEYLSRSTWACELKYTWETGSEVYDIVTLHVSVWVEIQVSWCYINVG